MIIDYFMMWFQKKPHYSMFGKKRQRSWFVLLGPVVGIAPSTYVGAAMLHDLYVGLVSTLCFTVSVVLKSVAIIKWAKLFCNDSSTGAMGQPRVG